MRRALASSAAFQILIQLLGLGTSILTARTLGPAGRGELAAIFGWCSTLAYVGNLGLPSAIAYFVARDPGRRTALLREASMISVLQWLALGTVAALVLPRVLGQSASAAMHAGLLFALAYFPLSLNLLYLNAAQQGVGAYTALNVSRLTTPLVYLVGLGVLAASHHLTVGSALAANLLGSVIPLSIAVRAQFAPSENAGTAAGGGGLRACLGYGLRAQLGILRPFSALQVDLLILSTMAPPTEVGLYAVALAGANLVRAQGAALGQVVLPEVARARLAKQRRRIVAFAGTAAVAVGGLCASIVALWGRQLIGGIFGVAFADALPMLEVLVLAGTLAAVEQIGAEALRGMGQGSSSSWCEVMNLAVGAPAIMLLAPRWGGIGAAGGVLLAAISSLFLTSLLLGRSLAHDPV